MEKISEKSIFVVYEDEASRTLASKFCDNLIQKFWAKCHLDVNWASFDELRQPAAGAHAAALAVKASIIVFVAEPTGWVPKEIREWAKTWAELRSDREGALIGLGDPGDGRTTKFTWIRHLSHYAGLDYLTKAREDLDEIPDSPDPYVARATAMTSVLDEILHQRTMPDRAVLP